MDFVTEADDLEKFSPSSDRRPFEVILRGGNPWGFTLSGGEREDTPLHISQIDDKSSAGNSALCVGDIVFSINGISCGSSAAAKQLIDSAFRTLTLKVLRGGWDPHRVPLSQASSLTSVPEREGQRADGSPKSRLAHDDSALYAHSKASQQSRPAMKPARRRGDSFHVSKTKPVPSSASSTPPWISNNDQPSPGAAPRSNYPDAFVHQRQLTVKDRRYSDAYPKLQQRNERHMVPSKSSPNLKKAESQGSLDQGREIVLSPSVKSVKSSPNIPEEVEKESWNYLGRSPLREEQVLTRSAGDYGWGRLSSCDDPNVRGKIYSEDMYTTDMIAGNEAKVLPSQALHKYEPDYENVALLGTAPLQSEKISEIDDIEDASDGEAPEVPPRPSYVDSENPDFFPPAPPVRDPSSLKYIRVNQNHEKYPSWPVTQPSAVSNHSQPINTRAQSWTDHTNTTKEFPSKQRLAYTPGLRPLPEKSPSAAESKGDDSAGKARNSSDPGFKSEFVYDKYGRVVQRKKGEKSGRFEEFYHNSKPGYPPPKLDSDGHNFGDKEYSAPSPPERDMAGIDQQTLSQVLGTMSDKRPPIGLHRLPLQAHSQLKEHQGQSTMYSSAQQQVPQPLCPVGPAASNRGISASHPYPAHLEGRHPVFHSMPAATSQADHSRRVDMATSPLKGPHETLSSVGDHPKGSSGMLSAVVTEKEALQSGSRYAGKAYIVRQTPYYNTSTQTDVQSYAIKTADPNARQRNVEIQVGEYSCQTSPQKEFEEKSIQARMSREFQPADLDSSQERHVEESQKKGYFHFHFEGIQSIKDKYATDEDSAHVPELPVFSHFNKGSEDQASIMRKLSEEFYGNKLGLAADKRHSSASSQEHSPKFMDSFHSGTMSQAESYTSVVIHPSESSAPFGRDDFGSQLSITDSKQELSSLASSSKSSLRDLAPRGRGSFDSFVFSQTLMPQPLQESKKYGSLSSFHHQRETSAPTLGHFPAHSQESVHCMQSSVSIDSKLRRSDFHKSSSSSTSESSSHPKSPLYAQLSGSTHYGSGHKEFGQVLELRTKTSVHHPRLDSLDSVFTDENVPERREGVSSSKGETTELLNRRTSMKKAFGIFDDAERVLSLGQKENVIKGRNPPVESHVQKLRPSSSSDTKLLGQIREVNENDALSVSDGSDSRQRRDSWRDELEKRTGYMKRTFPEQAHDRNDRMHQGSNRRQRVFDASIDSGVGSEVSSRADYCVTSSISADARDLKKQHEPQGNFVHMPSKSPDFSHEFASTSHSPTSESVSDLISKTNENLAKRADSFRRSSTSSSRNSSSDYMDMSRQERSRKETEWSRLRSSGSFLYGSDTTERPSNRSSTSSENAYEDISVFTTTTPHGSLLEITKEQEANTRGDKLSAKADDTSSMESSVITSPTYQNLSSLRRPPPPPPRTPSPEPHPPPALPPRSYSQKPANSDPASQVLGTSVSTKDEEGSTEEARRCVKSLVNQWESNSPREDAYAAQLRKQAMKLSGQRGPASGAVPSTMSVIHSRTQMGISTSYKREPMVAQEATQPVPNSTSVQSVSPCSSMLCISSSTEQRDPPSVLTIAETSISTPHLTQPKDSSNASFTERDSKSVPGAFPQVAERTHVPSWGEQHTPRRKTDGSTHKGPLLTPRDRSHSDKLHQRDSASSPSSQDAFSPFSQDASRERSASDTRIFSHEKTKEDRLPLSSQRHLDSSPSTSLKGSELSLIGDPGDLPPPPPELLNDKSSSPVKESQADEKYADDSYAAYKNRSSRQVGIYKRSSSAAVIRQDSGGNSEGADTTTFGDRRLGAQSWNSETHLLAANRHDTFRSGSVGGAGTDGANQPERPPDRPGNVPAFKADSSPAVRSVTKVTGGPQPLQARHQHSRTRSPQSHSPTARGGGSGGSLAAQPFAAAPHSQLKSRQDDGHRQSGGAPVGVSVTPTPMHQSQSRSQVDHGAKLERKDSFTSGPTTSVPLSNRTASPSHRWANVVPFEATHHLALSSESVNRGSGNSELASSKSRAVGHSDANSAMEHLSSGSFSLTVDSPERSRPGESFNRIVGTRPDPRADKAGPPLPSVETSHKKKVLASPGDDTKAVSGFYNRRESAPPPPSLIPRSSPRESPRRQSEGSFLPTRQEVDMRGVGGDLADTSVSHGRQPSQEELECDQKVLELAREVADSEKKLSDVLSADMASTRMKYIHGLFSGLDDSPKRTVPLPLSSRSPSQHQDIQAVTEEEAKVDDSQKKNSLPREYFVSPNKAMLQMEWRNNEEASKDLTRNIQDNETLIKQKEELIEKLYKKLEALKEERKSLQGEIDENNGLGKRVRETVEGKCSSASERDKFCTVVDDLEKIVRLLLNLSGQLARAENAVQALTENADPKLRKMTLDKREKLQTKHEEAKQLKEDIDKRTEVVSAFLRQSLSAEEHNDYTYFIKMKSKLTIDLQELEDKITLGEEQIQELRKSIPDKPLSTSAAASSAPSSPSLSPVPSS